MMIKFSEKTMIIYITAGFPSMDFTKKAILKLQDLGVSAIEIGVPYTDPVADGPVIAEAGQKSLEKGTNLDKIFDALESMKSQVKIPLYLMSYYSPVFTYGQDKYIQRCCRAGITGSIIPDLSYDEGMAFYKKQKENHLDPILLAFPNTSDQRIKEISDSTGSFIYYVNLFGTTGVRSVIPKEAYERLDHIKKISGKKICAGFGVSGKEDFDKLMHSADGVIIGSAVVKRMIENEKDENKIIKEIETFIHQILG